MIIDGHRHIVGDYMPVLVEMDALHIDRAVLIGVGVRSLAPVTIRDSMIFRSHFLFRTLGMMNARHLVASPEFQNNLLGAPKNDDVLMAIKERPDRFSGFAFINTESPNAMPELERCLGQGMQGIKLALVQYPTDLRGKNMMALCEVARARSLPVFMHLGLTPASSNYEWLADAFPEVNFIIAHAGVQCFDETERMARSRDNVFVDTSSHIATAAKIKRLCSTIGPRKLIFGSDIPVMCSNESEALAKVESLKLPDADKARILGENLAEILARVRH